MILAATAAILVAMSLALIRALKGPTLFDRIAAINVFGTKTVLLIALIAYSVGRADYLDLALVYAMINFISTMAVMKFFEAGFLPSAPVSEEK